jgi:hypothetical protein
MARTFVAQWLQSLKKFRLNKNPRAFNPDQLMRKLSRQAAQD